MNLLLLHVADCPHVGELTSRIDVALDGHRADLVLRQVDDVHEAIRLSMRGSPTPLIDGLDPFVAAPSQRSPVASRCPRWTSCELHSADCSVDRGREFGRRCCPLIGTNRPAQQQSSQVSPRQASRPSLTASTAMASAASGSAHHQPTLALRRRPPSRMAER